MEFENHVQGFVKISMVSLPWQLLTGNIIAESTLLCRPWPALLFQQQWLFSQLLQQERKYVDGYIHLKLFQLFTLGHS